MINRKIKLIDIVKNNSVVKLRNPETRDVKSVFVCKNSGFDQNNYLLGLRRGSAFKVKGKIWIIEEIGYLPKKRSKKRKTKNYMSSSLNNKIHFIR